MGRGRRITHQGHSVTPTAPADERDAGEPAGPAPGSAPAREQSLLDETTERDAHLPATGGSRAAGEAFAAQPAQENAGPGGLTGSPAPAVDRAAAAAVGADLASEHQASLEAAHEARERHADQELPDDPGSYLAHPEAFQRVYQQARDRIAAGQDAVPFMTEDATGGLGARGTGRGFGVEIEFDFPPGMSPEERRQAKTAIGRDLRAAGLTRTANQRGYHAAAGRGYSDAPNGWSFENDATVAGEIVSPIMYDEPRSWENLRQVTEIVRRHGGIASARTGGHVHVGLHDYDHTVENHSRLMRTTAAYEDVLFRLAANPERGEHRGTSWCRPNTVPADGYADVSAARARNLGHGLAVNLQHVNGRASDHAEFRMWDGSLDPAVIQTQIKVSLGLVDCALRTARTPDAVPAGTRHQLGHHRRQFGRRRQSGEAWRASTHSFRDLADRLFTRPQDRDQATALFAVTRWQGQRA